MLGSIELASFISEKKEEKNDAGIETGTEDFELRLELPRPDVS